VISAGNAPGAGRRDVPARGAKKHILMAASSRGRSPEGAGGCGTHDRVVIGTGPPRGKAVEGRAENAKLIDAAEGDQNNIAEAKLQTERKLGELLATLPKARGSRPSGNPRPEVTRYADWGIQPKAGQRWQPHVGQKRPRGAAAANTPATPVELERRLLRKGRDGAEGRGA
jgi:hypothetical protein